MTATERFYKGSKDDIISMDDETIYGDTFTKMSFKEAIEEGLLSDYKVITIDVQKSEIANFIKENNLVQLNDKWKKETEARSLASMLALRKAMKQFPIKNAVSFHSSIEKAIRNKELQSHITDSYNYEPIDTFTVSGKQPTTKRNAIVNEFAHSSKALITNAKCLTEGVDVPNIDCIVFADPRKSKVDIVQALGRALRKKEGKEWGYVILPVVYDDETQEIDNENFEEILAIVRGLASNDERIVEYFKDKSDKQNPSKTTDKQFHFDVFSEYINEKELSEQLQIRLWDKLSRFNWLPFEEAREFVRGLGLNSRVDWAIYCKSELKPINIPTSPEKVYSNNGWKSVGDWLGTERKQTQLIEYLNFKDARNFVKSLNLKGQKEWSVYCMSGLKPTDIPSKPQRTYLKNGWKGFGDWLGTGNISNSKKVFLDYNEARRYVSKLKLKSAKEWRLYCKSGEKPNNIPVNPDSTYKNNGWVNWVEWLNTDRIIPSNISYLDFNEAKLFVKTLNLKNEKEWVQYCKSKNKPINIPSSPKNVYTKEWKSVGDWLGSNNIAYGKKVYLTFSEVKLLVNNLKITSRKEWDTYYEENKSNLNIPKTLHYYYKSEWKGWADFLGKE